MSFVPFSPEKISSIMSNIKADPRQRIKDAKYEYWSKYFASNDDQRDVLVSDLYRMLLNHDFTCAPLPPLILWGLRLFPELFAQDPRLSFNPESEKFWVALLEYGRQGLEIAVAHYRGKSLSTILQTIDSRIENIRLCKVTMDYFSELSYVFEFMCHRLRLQPMWYDGDFTWYCPLRILRDYGLLDDNRYSMFVDIALRSFLMYSEDIRHGPAEYKEAVDKFIWYSYRGTATRAEILCGKYGDTFQKCVSDDHHYLLRQIIYWRGYRSCYLPEVVLLEIVRRDPLYIKRHVASRKRSTSKLFNRTNWSLTAQLLQVVLRHSELHEITEIFTIPKLRNVWRCQRGYIDPDLQEERRLCSVLEEVSTKVRPNGLVSTVFRILLNGNSNR